MQAARLYPGHSAATVATAPTFGHALITSASPRWVPTISCAPTSHRTRRASTASAVRITRPATPRCDGCTTARRNCRPWSMRRTLRRGSRPICRLLRYRGCTLRSASFARSARSNSANIKRRTAGASCGRHATLTDSPRSAARASPGGAAMRWDKSLPTAEQIELQASSQTRRAALRRRRRTIVSLSDDDRAAFVTAVVKRRVVSARWSAGYFRTACSRVDRPSRLTAGDLHCGRSVSALGADTAQVKHEPYGGIERWTDRKKRRARGRYEPAMADPPRQSEETRARRRAAWSAAKRAAQRALTGAPRKPASASAGPASQHTGKHRAANGARAMAECGGKEQRANRYQPRFRKKKSLKRKKYQEIGARRVDSAGHPNRASVVNRKAAH